MLEFLVATLPILILILLMTSKKGMDASSALPLVALMTFLTKYFFDHIPLKLLIVSSINGFFTAFVPIAIVFGAIFFFKTYERIGLIENLKIALNKICQNQVAQIMILGWCLAFLLEGASGFGTPAAIVAPLLVGLGLRSLQVAIFCLIMNTVPVSFGAIGTPLWFGFSALNLEHQELLEISKKTATLQFFCSLIIPIIALKFLISMKEIKKNFSFILCSLLSCSLPYVIIARYSYEFPSVLAGLIGLFITILISQFFYPKPKSNFRGLEKQQNKSKPSHIDIDNSFHGEEMMKWKSQDLKAFLPLTALVLFLLVTRIKSFGLYDLLKDNASWLHFKFQGFFDVHLSPSMVFSLQNLLGLEHPQAQVKIEFLYIPFIIPFILVGLIQVLYIKPDRKILFHSFKDSLTQMIKPSMALFFALIFVKLITLSDETLSIKSTTEIIGLTLSEHLGGAWNFLAVYLGALGSFFSGSATLSALTFSPIQMQISLAQELALNSSTILALQSVGGAMGNMICIHNIVAVCSVLGLKKQESYILKKTSWPVFLYGIIASLVALIIYH